MATKSGKNSKWSRNQKIALVGGICIPLLALLVAFLKGISEKPSKSTNVTVQNSPGAIVPTMVDSPNSTQVIELAPRNEFLSATNQIKKLTSENLSAFKRNNPQLPVQIVLEVEAGSIARIKVAEELGDLLWANELGFYNKGTMMGISPEYPITIFFGQTNDVIAKELSSAIFPLISGGIHLEKDLRLGANVCHLYLNGTPFFESNGRVNIQ